MDRSHSRARIQEDTGHVVAVKDVSFSVEEDITRVSQRDLKKLRRNKMAMVFQHFGLFPHRTVLDNVAYGLEVRGEGRQARHKKATDSP